MRQIIFITGTDTGAGKTVLTSLLLSRLRADGVSALALKPFCSGSRSDARRLFRIQDRALPLDTVNPFFFPEPLAPLVAARNAGRRIPLTSVVQHVRDVQQDAEVVLVEGAGGLYAPMGDDYTAADLIRTFRCKVLVAARNRLGVINHAMLTVRALESIGFFGTVIALMGCHRPDPSVESNAALLAEGLGRGRVFEVPFLPGGARLSGSESRCRQVLGQMLRGVDRAFVNGWR